MTTRIIPFDILSPGAFRKYTASMVFREFLKKTQPTPKYGVIRLSAVISGRWVSSSGGTLWRDNCQLIGLSLIVLARQAQKNRN